MTESAEGPFHRSTNDTAILHIGVVRPHCRDDMESATAREELDGRRARDVALVSGQVPSIEDLGYRLPRIGPALLCLQGVDDLGDLAPVPSAEQAGAISAWAPLRAPGGADEFSVGRDIIADVVEAVRSRQIPQRLAEAAEQGRTVLSPAKPCARVGKGDQHGGELQCRTLPGKDAVTGLEETARDGPYGIIERVSLEFHVLILRLVIVDYKPERCRRAS